MAHSVPSDRRTMCPPLKPEISNSLRSLSRVSPMLQALFRFPATVTYHRPHESLINFFDGLGYCPPQSHRPAMRARRRRQGLPTEGLYSFTSHRHLPLSYPIRIYRLICIFNFPTLSNEWPKQAGWEFRILSF